MTELELIERCRKGDREAQRELYGRTSPRIYRLLLRMTRSPEAAFDLAQETYLRVFTHFHQFDGRSSVATWVYRIAVTEALQHLRRVTRERNRTEETLPERPVESAAPGTVARMDLDDALAELPPTDRGVLLLRYQEGLDYREIAEVMECAEGTIASRLNRARNRLRELLGEDYLLREDSSIAQHQSR